jgi:hypothetical protein
MGFLSSLGGLASVAGVVTGQPWLSAAGSALGGLGANQDSRAAANKQMAFQQYNSNTAHQREVADLRKAGLNPILSARYGGSSTPTGAMPQMQNVTANVPGAMQAHSAADLQRTQEIYTQAQAIGQSLNNELIKLKDLPLAKVDYLTTRFRSMFTDYVEHLVDVSAGSAGMGVFTQDLVDDMTSLLIKSRDVSHSFYTTMLNGAITAAEGADSVIQIINEAASNVMKGLSDDEKAIPFGGQ